ncbi:hypothetical protein PRIPAC_87118, partial [Pristionchus pacificus]
LPSSRVVHPFSLSPFPSSLSRMHDSGGSPHAAAAAGAAAAVSLDEMMQRCQCPVCLLHFRNTPTKRGEARSLACSHLVCTGCLTNLIGQGSLGHCPVCRTAFNAERDPIPPVPQLNFLSDGVGRLQAAFAQQEEVARARLRAAEEEQQECNRQMHNANEAMKKMHAEKVARAAADAADAEDKLLQTARACTPPPDDVTTVVTVHILDASAVEDDVQTARATTPPRVAFAPGVFNDGAPGSAQQVAGTVAAAASAPDVDFDVATAKSQRSQSPHSRSSFASVHTARRCYSQSHNASSPVGAWAVAGRGRSNSSSSSSSSSSSVRSQHYSAGVMTARGSTPPPPRRALTPASGSRNTPHVSFPNAGPSSSVRVARSRSGSSGRSAQRSSRASTPLSRSPIAFSSIRSSAKPQGRAVTPAPGSRGRGGTAGSRSRHASPAAAVARAVNSARSSRVSTPRSASPSSKGRGRATSAKAKRETKASTSRGKKSSKSGSGRSARKAPMRRSKRSASAEATRRIHAFYNPRKSHP